MERNLRIRSLFENVAVWKKGSQRAPHKPLLLLYALGKCQRGEGRRIPFLEVEEKLVGLLAEYGPYRKNYHPEYPFMRLRNDGIWDIDGPEEALPALQIPDVKKSLLRKHHVNGGLKEEIYTYLASDRELFSEIVAIILNANFPETIHEDILQSVGIEMERIAHVGTVRDPRFRERILRAYEYQCAVCGYNVRVGNFPVGLEAAHIKWFQAGGPDVEQNGLALCSLHHKLFDRGVFTIQKELKVQVSEDANGTKGLTEWLLVFNGKAIKPPQRPAYCPQPEYLQWHDREVFRGPARYIK